MVPRSATRRSAGIVHQHSDFAEGLIDPVFEALDLLQLADIRRRHQHVGWAALRNGGNFRRGLFEDIAAEIGETNTQSDRGEPFRSRKADPARGAGHDRDFVLEFLHQILLFRAQAMPWPLPFSVEAYAPTSAGSTLGSSRGRAVVAPGRFCLSRRVTRY